MSGFASLLRQASFNGASFHVANTSRPGGRRLAIHEIPLRDQPYVEDLGKLPLKFSLRCYLIGEFAPLLRDALILQLEQPGPGLLVHPSFGRYQAFAGAITASEEEQTGQYCSIDVEFINAGAAASPLSITDTISSLLDVVASLESLVINSFVGQIAAFVLGGTGSALLGSLFGAAQAAFTALPQASQAGVVTGFAAAAGNPASVAALVWNASQSVAANVVALQPQPVADDPVAGSLPLYVPLADPSGGLAAIAAFGSALPSQPLADPAAQAAQTAVITLVQSAAVAAVLTVYAQTDFVSALAAESALEQLLDLAEQLVIAADAVDDSNAYRAWRAAGAAASAYIITEAQALPIQASYGTASCLPSLALAQRLYQDATQADPLFAFNGSPHPLFMPTSGVWLQAA